MIRCHAFLASILLFFFIVAPARAQETLMLLGFGYDNCDSFQESILNVNLDHSYAMSIAGMAYDQGICTEQNIQKAIEYYEQTFNKSPAFPNFPVYLAVIYETAHKPYQNKARASYLYKQIAISLAAFPDLTYRSDLLVKILPDNKITPMLQDALNWLEELQKEPVSERKKTALYLKQKGYKNTALLYEQAIEEGEPLRFGLHKLECQKDISKTPPQYKETENYDIPYTSHFFINETVQACWVQEWIEHNLGNEFTITMAIKDLVQKGSVAYAASLAEQYIQKHKATMGDNHKLYDVIGAYRAK